MKQILITLGTIITLLLTLVAGLKLDDITTKVFGGGGFAEKSCTSMTSTSVVVGPGNNGRVQLLATSSARANAIISLANSGNNIPATSSISLAFNNDIWATVGTGFTLATDTPYISFGRNTDFNYTGAVQGITSGGSTTVKITQCNY